MKRTILTLLIVSFGLAALGATVRPKETDAECMARMLWGEARGVESTAEKAAVCWVVLNRVDDHKYPDTIQDVIKQAYQFHGYSPNNPVDDELLAIAEDVIARWQAEPSCLGNIGRVLPREYTHFFGNGRRNTFFYVDKNGRVDWDWSLPSPYEEAAK